MLETAAGGTPIIGTEQNDVLLGTETDDTVEGHGGDDELHGFGGNDILLGGAGHDRLRGGLGDDYLDGGDGRDVVEYFNQDNGVTVDLSITGPQNTGRGVDTIVNVEGVNGSPFADVLSGTDRDEHFNGRGGFDAIYAGGGDDNVFAQAGGYFDGGAGTDWIYFGGVAGVVADLAGITIEQMSGSGLTVLGFENAYGTEQSDTLWGNGASNLIFGYSGNDTLDGRGGDDTLIGYTGDDILIGGDGEDVLSGDQQESQGGMSYDLNGNDHLIGGAGNDRLYGGGGADHLEGGSGDDLLLALGSGSILDGGEGVDRTFYSGLGIPYLNSTTPGLAIDMEYPEAGTGVAQGTRFVSIEHLTGTLAADRIYGTAGAETLVGHYGNDMLFGRGGDDVLIGSEDDDLLDGGTGNDTMQGGIGDDNYYVDSTGDVVIENMVQGTDRIYASVSFALTAGAHVEILSTTYNAGTGAINLTGNALWNTLYGNAGRNILDGGFGADVLMGLEGNDDYYVDNAGDQILEAASQGFDRVFVSSTSYVLTAGASIERLSTWDDLGTSAVSLTGNEFGQDLDGNDGNNILDGGGGDDWMHGRLGDDTYHVGSANDRAFENGGQGQDIVVASASYALQSGTSIERLSAASGTAAINLTGNELSQDIVGNAGSNYLIGGGGDDWFTGAAGNDFYYIDSANDRVFETAGQGYDTVYVSASFRLDPSAEIEVISADSLGGTSAISLVGTNIAQELWGNMGDNYFDAGNGSDFIYGIGGADIFAFATALGPNNVDRIYGFGGDDTILLSGDIFTAIAAGTLAANAYAFGSQASTASHRIIYDNSTGALLYDSDGSGAGAAVHFATIDAGLDIFSIEASSFVVTERASASGLKSSAGSEVGVADWAFPLQDGSERFGAVDQSAFGSFETEAQGFYALAPGRAEQEPVPLPLV